MGVKDALAVVEALIHLLASRLPSSRGGGGDVWPGFDPSMRRDLESIRTMVARQRQTPIREWPLVYDEALELVLVVREWPDGSITAYCIDNTNV